MPSAMSRTPVALQSRRVPATDGGKDRRPPEGIYNMRFRYLWTIFILDNRHYN
ncbi:unnamed protein product [Acanthoscelides obtectus]|uniref:Uncharacterized protein n=1 Tax=Acanthoscelides obtectus TaxID=200917 RepID=A0A9P0Q565_ACAOB|nr:unnamed protein product [Acanthoscelides obtectus]CAH2013199.1 unnamed protein product [Acanthoscelides obtectus]CAK1619890.1 hypothetical protein AOBTE_LOCUS62 [Acanthoscelides obtectus]CAK1619929.1 hypothetical protein AOBTE_LOCUS85 [Acanthoscelides obtectus]